jgi:aldose 1-epimerase
MSDDGFSFLPLGAVIQSFKIKGINIVQGFDTPEQYTKHNGPYFGETIGRVANRIKGSQLDGIDGKVWPLANNDRGNTLHGGIKGWGKRVWDGPKPIGVRDIPGIDGLEGGESVQFTLVSEDGDEGFPGTVEVSVIYTTGTQRGAEGGKDVIVLGIEYEAKLVSGAEETAINMTNHSYFNPAGVDKPTFEGTTITLATNQHLPVDDSAIPTGGPTPFPGLDTSKPFVSGPDGPKIDHCFTLAADPAAVPIDTRTQPLALNLAAHSPATGIHLEVLSTEPAFQCYTGDGINVPAVDGLPARGNRAGFCCEPSRWVNAPNVPEWRSQAVLKKGETYGTRIVYRGWAD